MNCEEFRATHLAGDPGEAGRRHLAGCAACRSRLPELRAAQSSLTDASLWEEPSPELADQIESLITMNARRASGRSQWSGRIVQLAAAAAAVVVALGLYGVLRSPAPDWEVSIPGTDLAPLAVGTVQGWNTGAGTRMVMMVDGLDPAPDGYVYEFWLSRGPLHISAGTFTSGGEVELWSGVTRADFPRLWITLEPIDEDESLSGRTVMDTG